MTLSAAHPLLPFASDRNTQRFRLTASARRQGEQLQLHYRLEGPLAELMLPTAAPSPERRDELWQHTCFEAFLAEAEAEAYREINLSCAGHWNLYRLAGYRQGLRPDPGVTALPFRLEQNAQQLQLAVSLDLAAVALAQAPLQLGLTAVLEHSGGHCSFWALSHPGPEADFHRREGWQLRL